MNRNKGSEDQVTVFSREGCVQCNATYRALDAKHITYKVLTVTEEIVTELRELGFMQLPVVRAPGMKSWGGFRPDKIDELASLTGGAL